MEAALLAYAGVTGPPNVIENPGGYLHAFSRAPEPGYLTEDLGRRWYGSEMLSKLAPVANSSPPWLHQWLDSKNLLRLE